MEILVSIENDIVYIETPKPVIGSISEILDKTSLMDLLAKHGAIILRGFSKSVENFSQYINEISNQVVKDPARSGNGNNTLVDAGYDAVGLHLENGTLSKVPDLCWFYCETPPKDGSQTTLCDGELVLESLSVVAREYFMRNKISYSRIFAEGQWRSMVALYYPKIGSANNATDNDLYRWALEQEGQDFEVHPDGSATSKYTVGAVRYSTISGRLAFANSMLTPSYNYVPPKITQANGENISDSIWSEVKNCTEICTREINWQAGDIAIIDNTRVMHGRRAIVSKQRKIYNTLSYIKD